MSGIVCVVCPFADVEKLKKYSCRSSVISMRSYPPQYPRSSTPLSPFPSLFLFFSSPPLFLWFFSFFSFLFLSSFSFFSFFFLSWSPLLVFGVFLLFFLLLFFWCVCVRVCLHPVCMCVRIFQFHVCRPMITSSIQNQILDMTINT